MKPIKPVIIASILVLAFSFLIPALVVLPFQNEKASGKLNEKKQPKGEKETDSIQVSVYRSMEKKIDRMPMEDYVAGVVAAEMPAQFRMEALKAQALTARTFIVNRLLYGGNSDLPQNADVTDTVNDQVYLSNDELKKIWGKQYRAKLNKIKKAVSATKGEIITYHNKPIDAAFFSTSNGYTENAKDYWTNPVPYLKSVKSPWDKTSPKFKKETVISVPVFEQKLGIKLSSNDMGTVLSRTKGKRVAKIQIAGNVFTGRQVRDKLSLPSSDFTWVRKGNEIVVTTKGYGHGVGMSQYGANGMAKEGKDYKAIVTYYYKGVEIVPIDAIVNPRMLAEK
ncbi:stage II sporulation protein D [Weizmannia acidilactici]|uniref:Stage II sporulation protein D n=1 Tax=Weizmannia acidilactici TaxID=2607726 RepID=A0A5J4JKI3_9BACI|nr:stage II sporulation protein D [Weizmannia acidilactici]GER69464.1 stage II sporulation protein D [Weizmannia acidilactici]